MSKTREAAFGKPLKMSQNLRSIWFYDIILEAMLKKDECRQGQQPCGLSSYQNGFDPLIGRGEKHDRQ